MDPRTETANDQDRVADCFDHSSQAGTDLSDQERGLTAMYLQRSELNAQIAAQEDIVVQARLTQSKESTVASEQVNDALTGSLISAPDQPQANITR